MSQIGRRSAHVSGRVIAAERAAARDEQPRSKLERVALDLFDAAARRALFERLGRDARRVLVITDGILIYLGTEQVAAPCVPSSTNETHACRLHVRFEDVPCRYSTALIPKYCKSTTLWTAICFGGLELSIS